MKFNIDDSVYNVFVTSEDMKCFVCGKVGHTRRVQLAEERSRRGPALRVQIEAAGEPGCDCGK